MNNEPASLSDRNPPAGHGIGWYILRGIEMTLLAMGAGLAIKFGAVCLLGTEQERHVRELDRIADWVQRARISPPAGESPAGWSGTLLGTVHNALYNPLLYARYTPTEKVRALADELDATGAKELATVDGVFHFMERLEKICPGAKDRGTFDQPRMEYGRSIPGAPAK